MFHRFNWSSLIVVGVTAGLFSVYLTRKPFQDRQIARSQTYTINRIWIKKETHNDTLWEVHSDLLQLEGALPAPVRVSSMDQRQLWSVFLKKNHWVSEVIQLSQDVPGIQVCWEDGECHHLRVQVVKP